MKKRILSVLLCMCMVLTLIPGIAMAETGSAPETIRICDMPLGNGDYIASNEDLTVCEDYTEGTQYVALYKDGVLYLNGIDIVNNPGGVAEGGETDRAIYWSYSSYGKHALVIELVEGTTNNVTDEKWAAINGASGWSGDGPSLTIQGKGTFNITGGSYGIWVWKDIIIQNGATVNVVGETKGGISNNDSTGQIIVKQGTNVTASGAEYGVSSDNSATGKFVIQGGKLTVKGNTAAVNKVKPDFEGNTVYVSNDVTGEGNAVWDGTTALTAYKYISLEGYGIGVTTYAVAKDTTENGSIEVDFEQSMASENVTITATPDEGYETENIVVTDASGSEVAVEGTGDIRTFVMPESDVTVSATFKATVPVSEGLVYGYAYDCQRSPAYPEYYGAEIELYGFTYPKRKEVYGSNYDYNEGPWTLTEVGTYGERDNFDPAIPSTDYGLESIVDDLAFIYDLSEEEANALVVHKMTDKDGVFNGYGILIGADITNGYALFIGDALSNGAGFLLSENEITDDSIIFVTEQLIKDTYTVTFDANGGYVEPASAKTDMDGKLAALPTPSKSGNYSFNGWYTASTGGTQVTVDTVFEEDTTIYAQWTYNGGGSSGGSSSYYVITFNTDGGSKILNQRLRKNAILAEPEQPTKEGCTFEGWYTDKECTNAYDFETRISKGFTLYAKWSGAEGEEIKEIPQTDDHVCPSKEYKDLDTTKWYHEDTDYVLANNIMLGTSDIVFEPDTNLTRGMLVTILYRSEGEPATNRSIPFADVDMGEYYANAVIWAQQNGIVKGMSDTEYAPELNVTREQLATIMFRYAQFKGMEAVSAEENLHFEDASEIAEYAVAAMNWGVGKNYIFGRTESRILPKEAASRAEIAAFIHRYLADNVK